MDSEMGIVDLIKKKTTGQALTEEEIEYIVKGVVDGTLEDVQLGAMLMAIKWKELDTQETSYLTRCMVKSGQVFSWPGSRRGTMVDKHSTGGVGDKISLVLVPILACCGVKIPMVSGRGLGHTGGTLDKMEAIPGVSVNFDMNSIKTMVEDVGCCIVGQTESLVPADKQLYAIRDVTDTVDNNGLIASSIVSKKVSENLDFLILDVKCGKAAIIQEEAAAEKLGKLMVDISNDLGTSTMALLTRMDHPIGLAIGNSLEIVESLRCLRWNCPVCSDSRKPCVHCRGCQDILELVYELGGHLLRSAGKTETLEQSRDMMEEKIKNGDAMNCFKKMIVAQGATQEVADCLCNPTTDFWAGLPKALHSRELQAERNGYVHEIDALKCGKASWKLGAGRSKANCEIKPGVGVELQVCLGDRIEIGDVWATVHYDSDTVPVEVETLLQEALVVKDQELTNANKSRVVKVIT